VGMWNFGLLSQKRDPRYLIDSWVSPQTLWPDPNIWWSDQETTMDIRKTQISTLWINHAKRPGLFVWQISCSFRLSKTVETMHHSVIMFCLIGKLFSFCSAQQF
jgi:hypothetical protein